MMRGDQYEIGFRVVHPETIPPVETADDIEVTVGTIKKRKSKGEVRYLVDDHVIACELSQKDTLGLCAGSVAMQVRIKFADGDVRGTTAGDARWNDSLSEEVL